MSRLGPCGGVAIGAFEIERAHDRAQRRLHSRDLSAEPEQLERVGQHDRAVGVGEGRDHVGDLEQRLVERDQPRADKHDVDLLVTRR